ncbi:MAG TPA: VWA domain-containing protein [Candidatus Acidoferrales bacterium]
MIFSSRPSRLPLRLLSAAFLLAAIALTGPFSPAGAQQQEPQPLQVTTEIVKLDAAVIDERGEFVSSLQMQNFKVLDTGTAQPIVFFAPTDAPAQILVMIETSPAVYLIQSDHLAALNALSAGLAAQDEIALVAYSQAPKMILPFTADRAALSDSLQQVQYTIGFGELNLFDSISAVLDSMSSIPGKKAIVLLTTGLDSSPASRWDALVQKLQASDVVIFPVALGASLRTPAKKNKSKGVTKSSEPHVFAAADQTLRSLAEITGGRAFFPESESDFVPAYAQIAATLRHQYLLGITPAHDGKFHPLAVELLDDSGSPVPNSQKTSRKIFVRQGYLAPAP